MNCKQYLPNPLLFFFFRVYIEQFPGHFQILFFPLNKTRGDEFTQISYIFYIIFQLEMLRTIVDTNMNSGLQQELPDFMKTEEELDDVGEM